MDAREKASAAEEKSVGSIGRERVNNCANKFIWN